MSKLNNVIKIALMLILLTQTLQANFFQLPIDENYDLEMEKIISQYSDSQNLIFLDSTSLGGAFDFLSSAFQKLTNIWPTIIGTLSTKRTTTVTQILEPKGFTFFDQTAHIQIVKGLRQEGMDPFCNVIAKRMGVPDNRRKDLIDVLEGTQYIESSVWSMFDIVFSVGETGVVKYGSIFSNKDTDGKFNFIIVEMDASFNLAPNIMFINTSLSVVGGVFSSSKESVKYLPANISTDDVHGIFSFFQVIAYKQAAAQFGIKLDTPK